MDKDEVTLAKVAATGAVASPFLGPYAIIGLCALFGALWTLSRMKDVQMWQAALFLFRAVSVSVVFTILAAHRLSDWLHYPTQEFLGPVAFSIAWVGDRWAELRDVVLRRFITKDGAK